MRTLGPSLASLTQSSWSFLSNALGGQYCINIQKKTMVFLAGVLIMTLYKGPFMRNLLEIIFLAIHKKQADFQYKNTYFMQWFGTLVSILICWLLPAQLGDVSCKEKCCPFVFVTLARQADKHNEERKTISLTTKSSEFLSSDVILGKYRPKVGLFLFVFPFYSQFFKQNFFSFEFYCL